MTHQFDQVVSNLLQQHNNPARPTIAFRVAPYQSNYVEKWRNKRFDFRKIQLLKIF